MWYNESAKRHRPQEGSLHRKDNIGSIPPSTDDEVFAAHGNVTETAIRYKTSRKTVTKWRKRWDGTVHNLEDQSRKPKHSPRKHSEAEIREIRRRLKKHHWTDLLLAYQEMKEHGYTRSYGGFKRIAAQLKAAKPKQRKKRKPKPYQRADYPGQKIQLDVKYVPSYCVVDSMKYTSLQPKTNAADGHTGKCTMSTALTVPRIF